MNRRNARVVSVLLSLGIGAVSVRGMAGAGPASPEERHSEPVSLLTVHLSVPPTLPESARHSLVDEVTAIWRRQAVSIEWTTGEIGGQSRRPFHLLVVPDRGGSAGLDEKPVTVGELLRSADGHAVAIATLGVAERIVREAQGSGPPPPNALSHHRLGLVLGRAAAHEIGHFLLGTPTHARRGLMRARFEAKEFVDIRSGTFELDGDARAWLERRLREGLPLGRTHLSRDEPDLRTNLDARDGFAYAP